MRGVTQSMKTWVVVIALASLVGLALLGWYGS